MLWRSISLGDAMVAVAGFPVSLLTIFAAVRHEATSRARRKLGSAVTAFRYETVAADSTRRRFLASLDSVFGSRLGTTLLLKVGKTESVRSKTHECTRNSRYDEVPRLHDLDTSKSDRQSYLWLGVFSAFLG